MKAQGWISVDEKTGKPYWHRQRCPDCEQPPHDVLVLHVYPRKKEVRRAVGRREVPVRIVVMEE